MRLLPLVLLAGLAAGCGGRPPSAEAPTRRVEVSGRFVTSYGDRAPRGVYGLRVHLLFRQSDGTLRAPSGRSRRHTHYDVLGEDGAFRFAFATADDLSDTRELVIAASTETETVRLVPTPPDAARRRTADGPVTLLLADALRQSVPAAGSIRAEGLRRELRPEIGVPVRYAEIARAFVHARYGGAPPFTLPQVRVELSPRGGHVFQAFDPDAFGGTEIEMNVSRAPTATIVAHEYGHYVSYRMWGARWWRYTLRNKNLREGWAIFFSFAVRAWAAQTYGDVDLGPSNPEAAPFTHLDGPARYDRIAYGLSHPDYSAIGALLWSLYDGADPSPFEYDPGMEGPPGPHSLRGDNDDITGQGLALFEAVRQSRASVFDEAGIAEVVARFKSAVPDALAPSVDGAVGFFLCPAFPDCDHKAPPSDDPATGALTLRPAAPGALAVRRLEDSGIELTWDRRVTAAPWGNPPDAYRVYRDGVLVATLGPEAASFVDASSPGSVYDVRAVGGGGESFAAPSVPVGPPAAAGGSGRTD